MGSNTAYNLDVTACFFCNSSSPNLAISNFLTLPLPVRGTSAGTAPWPSQKMCDGDLCFPSTLLTQSRTC